MILDMFDHHGEITGVHVQMVITELLEAFRKAVCVCVRVYVRALGRGGVPIWFLNMRLEGN